MSNNSASVNAAEKLAVLLPSLQGGGAERSMLNLVRGFLNAGRSVDLVLCEAKGAYMSEIPDGARVIELPAAGGFRSRWIAARANRRHLATALRPVVVAKKNSPVVARLAGLRNYLIRCRPDALISALTYTNLAALWARGMSGLPIPVVVSERNALATYCNSPRNAAKWRWRYLPELVRCNYPAADAVVAVSAHVARELTHRVGLAKDSVLVIHNPVVDDILRSRAGSPLDHDWFGPRSAPVILSAGRLSEQKDFATLIKAFAIVRAKRDARLLILGEGKLRGELRTLAQDCGVGQQVDMPGFDANPFRYMARACVFVSSSRFEGLPGALIQAMACGCPVVSTDCEGGSAEVLADGRYGELVRVGDPEAMAAGILRQMDRPTERQTLLSRAEDFSVEKSTVSYLQLIDSLASAAAVT